MESCVRDLYGLCRENLSYAFPQIWLIWKHKIARKGWNRGFIGTLLAPVIQLF